MERKTTRTITLSLPEEWKRFLDELATHGYNRSSLMLKMIKILKCLYEHQDTYPGGLPKMIERLCRHVESRRYLEEE